MIKRTLQIDTCLTGEIYDFLRLEMARGLVAQKTFAEIETEIGDSMAFIAYDKERPIGYTAVKKWQTVIELMTAVVRQEYRHQGIGTALIRAAMDTAGREFPNERIVALVNKNSKSIVVKSGFAPFFKLSMPDELRRACAGCPEENDFPGCHCETLIWPQSNQVRVCELDFADAKRVNELAEFYCRIWQEPPWNEYFWKQEEVAVDIAVKKRNDVWLVAIMNDQVVGFTAGRLAAGDDLQPFNAVGVAMPERVGYQTELGVMADYRRRGLGRELNRLIGRYFRSRGVGCLMTRTKAPGAMKIFRQAGFEQTNVSMSDDPERFYWILKM